MATYKVIQDIEAEDKLLGPLTLKQFIFAVVAAGFVFAAFMTVTKTGTILAAIPFLPFIALPAILAAPIGKDQPTDIWLAARIRFLIKPRKRIWDQSGIKELVTITAPKQVEKNYTNGLSETEVKSRLKALADTIDSRGWAVKNIDLNMSIAPAYGSNNYDRLIDPASLPQSVPTIDINASDDIMDAVSNPVAQHFDQMVRSSSAAQRAAAIARMQSAMPDSSEAQTEQELLQQIETKKQQAPDYNLHHKVVKTPEELTVDTQVQIKMPEVQQAQAVTPPKDPGIVELANTNDLSVASVAHIANRNTGQDNQEVIVKLH